MKNNDVRHTKIGAFFKCSYFVKRNYTIYEKNVTDTITAKVIVSFSLKQM